MWVEIGALLSAGITSVGSWFISVWDSLGGASYIIAIIACICLLFWIARASGVPSLNIGSDRARLEKK